MTELQVIKKLLGREIPTGYPNNIFGKQLSGKTLLTLQLSIQHAKKADGNILILDVDGGVDMFCQEWLSVFEQTYGWRGQVFIEPSWNTRHEAPNQKYVHFDLRTLQLLGIDAKAEISEGGKTEFVPKGVRPNKVQQYITEKKVKAIMIDSLSQVFKDCFSGMSSFGARARAEDMLYSLLKTLGLQYKDVLFFCSHHESQDPMKKTIHMAGGGAVILNSKISLYLEKMYGAAEGYARLYVFRYPNIPEWGKVEYLQYTDAGIVDSAREEVEALLQASRKR